MKKLNVAIIGQGRSGRNIHGTYFLGEKNEYYNVKYVVDEDEYRRNLAKETYPGCEVFADYRDLFAIDDVDLVVNSTYSDLHYPITKDLLQHGKNVLVEKPLGRTRFECDDLIKTAKDNNVTLAVFMQTFFAPYYEFAYETIKSGRLGDVKQISIRFNGFSRRWDWQTLQKRCAGNAYNTGPHPIGIALGFVDFDKNSKVVYTKLGSALTCGDSDDYVKILIDTPDKPVLDIEISNTDAYANYNVKIQGSKGTMKLTPLKYEMTYIVDGENPPQPVKETFLENAEKKPCYCREDFIKHTEEGEFTGTAFDTGTQKLYEQLYFKLTEGRPMTVTPEMGAEVIGIIEMCHIQNPLPRKY